jgi:hypothetical protein
MAMATTTSERRTQTATAYINRVSTGPAGAVPYYLSWDDDASESFDQVVESMDFEVSIPADAALRTFTEDGEEVPADELAADGPPAGSTTLLFPAGASRGLTLGEATRQGVVVGPRKVLTSDRRELSFAWLARRAE